jgi:hypothetical protein
MLIVFLVGKLIIYSAWCYVGLRLFRSHRIFSAPKVSLLDASIADNAAHAAVTASTKQALGLGFFRLVIGIVFGVIAIFVGGAFIGGATNTFDSGVLVYTLFLVPVRALEWWITARIIGKTSDSARVLLWVFGGIVLSCLADIPTSFAAVSLFSGLC